jgi:hypothetical protein
MGSVSRDDFYWISYNFKFAGQRPDIEFLVLLDKKTLIALPPEESSEQPWTRLEFHQCPICPLKPVEVKNCPIAYNISGLIEKFKLLISFDMVETYVNVEERCYYKRDTVQQGLRSILGIYLASSGCPHMKILKPMVRFHLPFASMDESLYRHVTSYLLQQYFEYTSGKRPDIDLQEMKRKNELVDQVNRGIIDRIEGFVEGDANKNALVILNTLGMIIKFGIDERLEQFKHLFCEEC